MSPKQFHLRIPDEVYEQVQTSASASMRSVNSEFVWLVSNALAIQNFAGSSTTMNTAYNTFSASNSLGSGAVNAITAYGELLEALADNDEGES